jgi:biopolymer transport protein ExbB/TolQ
MAEAREKMQKDLEEALLRRASRLPGVMAQVALTLLLLLAFYLLRPAWAQMPRVHELLFERGTIPIFTVWLAMFALGDLIWKLSAGWFVERDARRQVALRGEGPLEASALESLATRLRDNAAQTSAPGRYSVRLHRLAVGLLQHSRGDNKSSVREALRSQADADDASMASRYLMVKVFIWALPLLGFIGTVEGIGDGVGQFARSLPGAVAQEQVASPTAGIPPAPKEESVADIKASLSKVTSGLGRAFDTTYLALVLTVFLMIFMTIVEKVEGDRLTRLAEECETNFVGRLSADTAQ